MVALVQEDIATFELGITVEIFGLNRPEMGPDWYRFAVAAVTPGSISARGGVSINVDGGLELLADAATIIIPGWGYEGSSPVPESLTRALHAARARGAKVAAICGGAFVLGASGLLTGRKATTHWLFTEKFARMFPDVELLPDVLYVDDDGVLTSAGSAAGIDLCLHIVRSDFGAVAANRVARRLVVPSHREGGQAQFVERPVPSSYEGVRFGPLLDDMRRRIAENQPLPALARRAGMSSRTFLRKFKATTGVTPAQWLLMERLALARDLLESTDKPADDIALTCGFGSVATMRHHFRTRLGTSPVAFRSIFKQMPANPVMEVTQA